MDARAVPGAQARVSAAKTTADCSSALEDIPVEMLFPASDTAGFINGNALAIDGGWSAY